MVSRHCQLLLDPTNILLCCDIKCARHDELLVTGSCVGWHLDAEEDKPCCLRLHDDHTNSAHRRRRCVKSMAFEPSSCTPRDLPGCCAAQCAWRCRSRPATAHESSRKSLTNMEHRSPAFRPMLPNTHACLIGCGLKLHELPVGILKLGATLREVRGILHLPFQNYGDDSQKSTENQCLVSLTS